MSDVKFDRRQLLSYFGIATTATLISLSVQGCTPNGTDSEVLNLGDESFSVVDNIFSLLNNEPGSNDTIVLVKGYHEPMDGGGGIFVYDPNILPSEHNGATVISTKYNRPDWDQFSELAVWYGLVEASLTGSGGWRRLFDGQLNVLYFGAKRDGSDDTMSIKAALLQLKPVFFPKGVYTVSETIEVPGFVLVGESASRSSIIEYTGSSFLFKTNGYYEDIGKQWITATNMTFRGNYVHHTNSKQSCFHLSRENNRADVDAKFYNCEFIDFHTAAHIVGRGIDFNECYFVGIFHGLYLDRISDEIEWDGDSEKHNTGGRAYVIRGSRFHSMGSGACIVNKDENNPFRQYARGISFVGNYIDTSCSIFVGSCSESVFSSNTHIYGAGESSRAVFEVEGQFFNNVITSNNFAGMARRVFSSIMHFNSDSFCKGLNFSGNSVDNVAKYIIESEGRMYDSLICNNVFTDIALSVNVTNNCVFMIGLESGRILINGNIFSLSTSSRVVNSIVKGEGASMVTLSNNLSTF
ncbi:hypothetical protein FG071_18705 [Vibrio cholerae]|nr:hypothetical protein [Vibrio cholerae]